MKRRLSPGEGSGGRKNGEAVPRSAPNPGGRRLDPEMAGTRGEGDGNGGTARRTAAAGGAAGEAEESWGSEGCNGGPTVHDGHDAQRVGTSSMPDIVLVEPPCLPAQREHEVKIHLTHEAQPGQDLQVVLMRNRVVEAALPLDAEGGKVARFVFPALEPCAAEVCIKSQGMTTIADGQPTTSLMFLPDGVWEEACQLPERAFDCVRRGTLQSQAEFLETSPGQAQLEEFVTDQKIREAVWRKHFQIFSQDLGRLLEALGASTGLEDQDKSLLHRMLVYLMTNSAWATTSFLLRTCMDTGIVVATGDMPLSLSHIGPAQLRELAQELVRTRQQGAGEVMSMVENHL